MQKKGISLIVLSITILVMAILAATAIIALEDSGIIGRAKNTTKNSNYADEYTRLNVIKNGILTDNLGTITVAEYIGELTNKGLIESTIVDNADGSKTVTTKTGFEVKIAQKGTSDLGIAIEGYTQNNTANNSNNSSGSDDTTSDDTTKVSLVNGEGTSSSPYIITSADELVSLATQVNLGYDSEGIYFQLDCPLNMSNLTTWGKIGKSEEYSFKGIFDGNGQVVAYLTSSEGGLFGYSYGTIKNFVLESFEISKTAAYLGGLVDNNYGTLENCTVKNSIIEGANYVGGLVGINGSGSNINNSSTENCTITGESYVGGCVGQNVSSILDTSVSSCTITADSVIGGFAGGNTGEIANCTLEGMSQFTFIGQNYGLLIDCINDGIIVTK